eukprot:1159538-Pelagomonas_calceolata.AAC.2
MTGLNYEHDKKAEPCVRGCGLQGEHVTTSCFAALFCTAVTLQRHEECTAQLEHTCQICVHSDWCVHTGRTDSVHSGTEHVGHTHQLACMKMEHRPACTEYRTY